VLPLVNGLLRPVHHRATEPVTWWDKLRASSNHF
jgi:hypothetical protein